MVFRCTHIGLEVGRADLAAALKGLRQWTGGRVPVVSLRFEKGSLSIESANKTVRVRARGIWPATMRVRGSWIQRLAKSLPAGEPIVLRVDKGRLSVNRYSEPCECAPTDRTEEPEWRGVDEERLILEAAKVLEPLLITRSDLETLVEQARARGPAEWRLEERKMLALVAKAWQKLAPLGVEPSDIRRLLDMTVRNAWKKL